MSEGDGGKEQVRGAMVLTKKVSLYVVLVLALLAIVYAPDRAGDLVRITFEAVSGAVRGAGDLITELVS